MSYHRLPTALLASRHRGAGGGAVDNQQPQGSTYLRQNSVQSSGATSRALRLNNPNDMDERWLGVCGVVDQRRCGW